MTWAIFDDEHVRAIGEILMSSSDRVTTVVGGALLDDTLRRTLSERLRDHPDIRNKLLKVGGALGNTVPKVDLLFMLYAFDKPARDTLYGLADIRNFFAHNLGASFDSADKKITDALKKLCLHEGRTVYPHRIYDGDTKEPIEPISNNRDVFLVNLKLCLIFLMRDRVSHITWANTPKTKKALAEQKRLWKSKEQQGETNVVRFTTSAAPYAPPNIKKP